MPTISRSWGSWFISWKKPCPSSAPSRLAVGTLTSSKNSSDVSWALRPSFSRLRPRLKPSAPSVSTTIRETPRAFSSGSVLATTITRSACWPLVMKVFWPLTTYWLPAMRAVVRTAWRSEPVPGSVMAMAPTSSPVAIFGSQRRFCSSEP